MIPLFTRNILTKLKSLIFPVKRDCIIVWFGGKPVIRQYGHPLKHGHGMTWHEAERLVGLNREVEQLETLTIGDQSCQTPK